MFQKLLSAIGRLIVRQAQALVARIRREPLLVRSAIGAVTTFLVAEGIIDTGLAQQSEIVIMGVVNTLLLLTARDKVYPEPTVDEIVADLVARPD